MRRFQERNDARFKDLEDAILVQAHLEARMSRSMRQHAEWVEEHESRIQEHESRMQRIEILLAEMTEKVNFLIDRDMRREDGPESR